MKSMFDDSEIDLLKSRLARLNATASPKWGSFSAPKMICHIIDQMEFSLSEDAAEGELEKGPPLLLRHAIRTFLPWPKNAPTAAEMLSTQPDNWDADIKKVIELIDAFSNASGKELWPFHPFFGKLNGNQWAKLTWRHTDFHFKQFGC